MRKILEELGNRDTIAIGGHVRPDGDCVGSSRACSRFAVIHIAAAGRIADMMIHIDRLFCGPEILFRIPEPFL